MPKKWYSGSLSVLAWITLAFLVIPSFVVLPVSLTDTSYLALPEHELSLQHWRAVFTNPKWIGGMQQSLVIGFAATCIATVCGSLCAIGCWKLSSRLGETVRVLMLVPLIVPGIVYALGLYRIYAGIGLLDTYWGVIIAHAVIGMPFVMITVGAALANFDKRLEQAARNLGASFRQILHYVILPNIRPGIFAGAVFAFIASWDELIVVLFIASRHIRTLPREIWAGVRESLDPTIAVVAVVFIGMTFIALIASLRSERAGKANTVATP